MLNQFLVAGRLTADPEMQNIGENRLCKFTIACDRPKRKGQNDYETDFSLASLGTEMLIPLSAILRKAT